MLVAALPCFENGVRVAFSVSVPKRGSSCGILTMKAAMLSTKEPFTTAVQMWVTIHGWMRSDLELDCNLGSILFLALYLCQVP
jgi:hypothetical protein